MSIRHIREHPKRAELVEHAARSTLFGVPTTDMDREDLLMMIGMLAEDRRQDAEMHQRDLDVLRDLHMPR